MKVNNLSENGYHTGNGNIILYVPNIFSLGCDDRPG
jgi:hypothetical protein